MKTIFKKTILLLSATVLFLSCSQETATVPDAKDTNSFATRNAGEVYEDFAELFRTLYGSDYTVRNSSMEVLEDNITYYVTEVYVIRNSVSTLQGYFLESPTNVLYLEHISATGTLNQYDYNGSDYVRNTADLTLDSKYASYGFTPIRPNGATSKFWGWDAPQLSGECENGQMAWIQIHYVFWVQNGVRDVMQIDGVTPLTSPCE